MATQTEVVYPSTTSFSGSTQLNLGPYAVPSVNWLLRAEVRGAVNFSSITVPGAYSSANWQLWAVQWVPSGAGASDIVTTADGPQFLIREQLGANDLINPYTVGTGTTYVGASLAMKASWAGQIVIGTSINLFLSLKPPTGATVSNFNLYASLRFWWA